MIRNIHLWLTVESADYLEITSVKVLVLSRHFPCENLKRKLSVIPFHSGFIQSRGFKTLKSRTRRLQSTSERLAETQHTAPSFVKVIRPFFVVV